MYAIQHLELCICFQEGNKCLDGYANTFIFMWRSFTAADGGLVFWTALLTVNVTSPALQMNISGWGSWVQVPKQQVQPYRRSGPITAQHQTSFPPLLSVTASPRRPLLSCSSAATLRGFGVKRGEGTRHWSEAIAVGSPSSCPLLYLNATSQPITHQTCLLFHFSNLSSQEMRVTLGSSPSPPFLFLPPRISPLSISHPLLPVQRLVYGGRHWANSISSPSACRSATAARLLAHFSSRSSLRFLHFTPPLPFLCYTEHSISSSVAHIFHYLSFL